MRRSKTGGVVPFQSRYLISRSQVQNFSLAVDRKFETPWVAFQSGNADLVFEMGIFHWGILLDGREGDQFLSRLELGYLGPLFSSSGHS